MTAFDIIGSVLVVLGALVFATAALGVLRFPDVYTRASAVGTAGGLGIVLVVLGALVLQPTVADAVKVVIIVILQLATSAIGTIAIARSAYLTGTEAKRLEFNELESDELEQ
ncbi:monovalent cation/H(+) antiporter subunit G [Marisediminicola sp. LYQ85]|uniref:monovalent cation/H(+) antiporter subunit G n=1 Tax=Marisediminicola sp. LYQ85 TaxID=3391062 RepID=UPI0039833E15